MIACNKIAYKNFVLYLVPAPSLFAYNFMQLIIFGPRITRINADFSSHAQL